MCIFVDLSLTLIILYNYVEIVSVYDLLGVKIYTDYLLGIGFQFVAC